VSGEVSQTVTCCFLILTTTLLANSSRNPANQEAKKLELQKEREERALERQRLREEAREEARLLEGVSPSKGGSRSSSSRRSSSSYSRSSPAPAAALKGGSGAKKSGAIGPRNRYVGSVVHLSLSLRARERK
jgi:hypothetical protein